MVAWQATKSGDFMFFQKKKRANVDAQVLIDLKRYIDAVYESAPAPLPRATEAERCGTPLPQSAPRIPMGAVPSPQRMRAKASYEESEACEEAPLPLNASLKDALETLDESFSEMLLRKIDESGMTDAQCYKKAHIDRKLFSKIRSNPLYRPTKQTAVSFALALELSLPETVELLQKAGFALSHSSRFDIIIEYFILHENYNIMEINEALYEFDQVLLS